MALESLGKPLIATFAEDVPNGARSKAIKLRTNEWLFMKLLPII